VESIRLRWTLGAITPENFEDEGRQPPEKIWTLWRILGQVILGPSGALVEKAPREIQLNKQAARLATLHKRIKDSSNLELFIHRIATENSTTDPEYSFEEPTEEVKVPGDYKWWEITLSIFIPHLFPVVQ